MRFPGKSPPQTPAQRQAKCRAIKRGTYEYCEVVPPRPPLPPGLPNPTNPNRLPHIIAEQQRLALSAPANSPAAPPAQRALPLPAAPPAPPTAIQKSLSSDTRSLALLHEGRGGEECGDGPPRLCLPAGVAARL